MAKTHYIQHSELGDMIDSSHPVIWTLPAKANTVAGTADFVAGSFVYRTLGYLNIATVDTVALGIAMEPCEDAIADLQVLVFTEMTGIAMTVCADNAKTAHVLLDTNLGVTYSVAVDADLLWYIDVGDTGAMKVKIQKTISTSPVGDTMARVIATVLPAYREVV